MSCQADSQANTQRDYDQERDQDDRSQSDPSSSTLSTVISSQICKFLAIGPDDIVIFAICWWMPTGI